MAGTPRSVIRCIKVSRRTEVPQFYHVKRRLPKFRRPFYNDTALETNLLGTDHVVSLVEDFDGG